ncbi:hypothetical protein BMR1_02g02055 [Babesia microti strain RI]|uniref:Uncharacterized protein n=1 Tax=Babesia microti (strain RI) TaxID=1133968 RepID=I7JA26_BABMR|nr:hypothetical protein BMR1_02g02055 [Babesia microti strain RI]CCF73569.1 hypothetical protein BMR1_02g02055 [Babesia microti strain RI]|eukprot:XP_012648178.1 hypothetical protein BMR1_02g02055 [Babesia microti strain RI]
MVLLHNNYNEVQFEKYFLRWCKRFNALKLEGHTKQNSKTINLIKQLSNVVLRDSYLMVLCDVLGSSNTRAAAIFIRLLVSISSLCLRANRDGMFPIGTMRRVNTDVNSEVIDRCYVILYKLLPSAIMKFLSIRSYSRLNRVPDKYLKVKNDLYTLLINISHLISKNLKVKKNNGNKCIYSVYKAMPKGNTKSVLKNAIVHIYRLRNNNFRLSNDDIFKEIKKKAKITGSTSDRQNYLNNFVIPTNCFEQKNVANIGSIIIRCIEFMAKGLRIDVDMCRTKNVDKLLIKCHIKLQSIKNNPFTHFAMKYGDKEQICNDDNTTGIKNKLVKTPSKTTFRDMYLKLLELISDGNSNRYTNKQSIELTDDDLTKLIVMHGEIRRLIWGPALIRYMKLRECCEFNIKNDKISQIRKFSQTELDRVLAINGLLERMSLTLGFGRPSWLAAAQNHTDSYILKS